MRYEPLAPTFPPSGWDQAALRLRNFQPANPAIKEANSISAYSLSVGTGVATGWALSVAAWATAAPMAKP